MFSIPTHAEGKEGVTSDDIDEDKEEGGITQHDMFEFEAFIKHGDVSFGTAPFDKDDEPGNDSADDNGIVRSWDTVTYPLKITVNPKKADSLKDIELQISGTLENGITEDRVNATFAIGGKEDMDKQEVSFVQNYTIERTGNSIMIPVTVEVKGAKNGVKLRPDFKVEVVSVDGEKITGAETHFDELPSSTVSSKVSIKPIINSGLSGQGVPFLPYSAITRNDDDLDNIHAFALSWGLVKLPNKEDLKGATFPDPDGVIDYAMDFTAEITWDRDPNGKTMDDFESIPGKVTSTNKSSTTIKTTKKGDDGRTYVLTENTNGKRLNMTVTETLDFGGKDTPFVLFDHHNIGSIGSKIGSKNTFMEGENYRYRMNGSDMFLRYSAPQSSGADKGKEKNAVWDSGTWDIHSVEESSKLMRYQGTNTGYTIGSTFPRHRADGYTGSFLYGVNERVFASQGFIVKMPNEYRHGGPNNPDRIHNTVTYKSSVKLDKFTDKDDNEINFNKTVNRQFTERNEGGIGYSVRNSYFSTGNKELGTPNIGYSLVSNGDASILRGDDVRFRSAIHSSYTSYGGYRAIQRWNTDAFELTESYAKTAENSLYSLGYYDSKLDLIKNDKNNVDVLYGVPKFTDNTFVNFTAKGIDDYDWYDSYDEAVEHGEIGAIQENVEAAVGAKARSFANTPLKVKHDNIEYGSLTKDGSHLVSVTNYYVYPEADRKEMIDVSEKKVYENPTLWGEDGSIEKLQKPVKSTTNFETLGVLPAETSSELSADKNTYYNSETIKWTAKNGIVLPATGVPDDIDSSVQVKQVLPKGLTFKTGSGKVGEREVEPEIITDDNGETTLVWDLLVSNSNKSLDNITFETTINPYALTSGVQSSLTVYNVIESDLDMRPVKLRESQTSVSVIKVGMVGIHESINKQFGPKNSDYTVTLNPYTTIEDERDVAGLTHIPSNDDGIGSKFTGDIPLKDISLEADREHHDDISIYLNDKFIETDKPNLIDVSKDGWYEYEDEDTVLDDVKSIYFVVNGLMTNKDDIRIHLTLQTQNNDFGDTYMNETIINSAVDYKLSPLSNRVRYTIRPEWELSMERIQIFTDKYDNGLPVRVRIGENQPYGKDADISDLEFNLVLYDKESGDKVASQKVKQPDFKNEITMKIPKDKLKKKNDKRRYEAKIENYDENRVWAKEPKIDTDGYTASEKVIKTSNISDGKAIQAGVAVTERVLGEPITEYKDEITLDDVDIYTNPFATKSGYSYQFAGEMKYTNEMLETVKNIVGINTSSEVEYLVDKALVDQNLIDGDYAESDAFKVVGDKISIKPSAIESDSANKSETIYSLEDIFIERGTGKLFTRSQVDKIKDNNKESDYQPFIDTSLIIDEKYQDDNILYVPIWIDELGEYEINLTSNNPIGSNYVTFDLDGTVDVEAYMFNHINSKTTKKDEILINQFKTD